MIYREKPCFIIKKNLQKSGTTGVYFCDSVTKQVLTDVCYKILKLNDFEVQYVENDYEDEYMEPTYNKGRLAILHYKDEVNYISFSEADIGGRNSSVQSVPTAFNIFYKSTAKKKNLYYYFLNYVGNAETDYQIFIYRLMNTIGFNFLNADKKLENEIIPFNSIEDIIFSRRINAGRNSGNNSTYINKSTSNTIEIYGKTYGANKYESAMICYALSYLSIAKYKMTLYEVMDNTLKELPKSCREVIEKMGKIEIIPTDITLEKKSFDENNSLRSPRFIFNLFDKYGNKKCMLCNCEIPEIVQGAHIWPVSNIKKKDNLTIDEKLKYATDGENGIWLCENHHKLFDENIIVLKSDGKVEYRKDLTEKQIEFLREITTIPYIDPEMLSEKFVMYLEKRYSEVA